MAAGAPSEKEEVSRKCLGSGAPSEKEEDRVERPRVGQSVHGHGGAGGEGERGGHLFEEDESEEGVAPPDRGLRLGRAGRAARGAAPQPHPSEGRGGGRAAEAAHGGGSPPPGPRGVLWPERCGCAEHVRWSMSPRSRGRGERCPWSSPSRLRAEVREAAEGDAAEDPAEVRAPRVSTPSNKGRIASSLRPSGGPSGACALLHRSSCSSKVASGRKVVIAVQSGCSCICTSQSCL